ncbi:hypothetical protein M378DRAFT_155944 [Amanita muscaria Koide BX008]|uniref:Uncharacterized protein n=1 Tax=Amanita muscaria (strain Koide BX008) TaxID=946122 RepID=A0A0C2X9E8_AMAMK|nr:hypothetical protein M378DRAFT_155944 [Amanita muscaria Koide BX008]
MDLNDGLVMLMITIRRIVCPGMNQGHYQEHRLSAYEFNQIENTYLSIRHDHWRFFQNELVGLFNISIDDCLIAGTCNGQ